MKRADTRAWDELRPTRITPGFQEFAEGSAIIQTGKTQVLCSVSVEERVPAFLKGKGSGWITAEYSMLPRSTVTRTQRDSTIGRVTGRNQEIQRLIGRSLRAIADLDALGERTLIVDCDVLQADGGTINVFNGEVQGYCRHLFTIVFCRISHAADDGGFFGKIKRVRQPAVFFC